MTQKNESLRFLNAYLLVVGTSVGAGMLGMPIEAAQGGYVPSLFFLLASCLVSLISAIFFVEILSYIKGSANFSSLAEKILGSSSKIYVILLYLLLFLSLIFAYVKGGGVFLTDIFPDLPILISTFLFLVFFFPFILKGASAIGKINAILTFPMFAIFILMLAMGFSKVDVVNLSHQSWKYGFSSLPILVTAFGFHGVIPSLAKYLNYNKKKIRKAMIAGSFTSLLIYVLWQTYIMGIVPLEGEISLISALVLDQTAITPLRKILGFNAISHCAGAFYFCALTTSFLGVSLGLTDFLIDSFKLKGSTYNKLVIGLLVFIPALILSGTSLRVFYLSLKYGSGLACTLLLIVFPTLMIIKNLQKKNQYTKDQLFSLKLGSFITLVFSSAVIVSQLMDIFYY